MSETNYVILRPIEPPRICYLWEAIQWRAFGTYPISYWDYNGREVREYPEGADLFDPNIPDDNREKTYLSLSQTEMAGLPPDPSFAFLPAELAADEPKIAIYELTKVWPADSINAERQQKIRAQQEAYAEFELARDKMEVAYKEWRKEHDAYIDQFQAELLLALRRGDLVAQGRKLPHRDHSKAHRIFDAKGYYTDDIEPSDIPADLWVSNYVNWLTCSLKSAETSYVWIYITVADMLRIFPPSQIVGKAKMVQMGDTFAIAENSVSVSKAEPNSRRGRPPLPWEDFYVEVARHYRDGTMPEKKEAAIQMLMDWFKSSKGIEASRSAVGEKLKPYFDALKPNSNSDRK